jgi:S1-C subfamily serine protease
MHDPRLISVVRLSFGWLLALSLLATGCRTTSRSGPAARLEARVALATAEVLVDGRIEGSGWFADRDGHVVTAAHVIRRQTTGIEVRWRQDRRSPATVVATDLGHDLALLRVDNPGRDITFLEIAPGTPVPGQDVRFYGMALFYHRVMICGTVARSRDTYTYFTDRTMPMRVYQIAAPSPPGTSGGPWLDCRGRVVGSQSGFLTHAGVGAGLAMVAPPDAIRRLVRTRTTVVTAAMGCGFEELWSQAAGFVARFPKGTQGVVTVPLDKDGPAARAGLTQESLIVAVDGQPVCFREEMYGQLYRHQPGEVLQLTVLAPDNPTPRQVPVELARVGE